MEKIVVIGAGIMGASLAWALAGAGRDVTVVDAGLPASGASGRSFGWINASFHLSRAHYDLRLAGIEAHRRLIHHLPGPHLFKGCLWWGEAGEVFLTGPFARLGKMGINAHPAGKCGVLGQKGASRPRPGLALRLQDRPPRIFRRLAQHFLDPDQLVVFRQPV